MRFHATLCQLMLASPQLVEFMQFCPLKHDKWPFKKQHATLCHANYYYSEEQNPESRHFINAGISTTGRSWLWAILVFPTWTDALFIIDEMDGRQLAPAILRWISWCSCISDSGSTLITRVAGQWGLEDYQLPFFSPYILSTFWWFVNFSIFRIYGLFMHAAQWRF